MSPSRVRLEEKTRFGMGQYPVLKLAAQATVQWNGSAPDGVVLKDVFFGPDPKGLGGFEIATAEADRIPTSSELRTLHKERLKGRDASLVVAVAVGPNVLLLGPDSNTQPLTSPLELATRQLQAALDEADSLQATKRFLSLSDAQNQTRMSGVRNRGLFATYHLRENTIKRPDWDRFQQTSQSIIHSRSQKLIEDLGFTVAERTNHALVLNGPNDKTRAVALLLDETESFDSESSRFHTSPVSWGLSVAASKDVPWLIMLRREQIRLYPAKDGVGVGQKGQTETYLELDLAALAEEYLGLLALVFSAEALSESGTAQELLDESVRYASALGDRLRERVYERVVPNLARAVAFELEQTGLELDGQGLQDAYRTTLRILFRLLFQAYAEDRGLLPAGRSQEFDKRSLTVQATRLANGETEFDNSTSMWDRLTEVWHAIDHGNDSWRVPAYNGGLFGSDPELRPYGALIKKISLPDTVMGPALHALLVDHTEDGVAGMVDFRSLSVREFGTIYEGLLESSLSVATEDLTVDPSGAWVPARDGEGIEARKGEPYFHNTSGERKATGSYFTPDFIVDHLIERSIDPTLDRHLQNIQALVSEGREADAAKQFFDYRVGDIAMGSAHFLVAAVDRIESRMRSFLAQPGNEIPGVSNELARLAEAARKALGEDLVAIEDIDDAVLLRRQIARRCIYGVDINPLAVELARLAIWIHTFVPGLPMSTLDHNLVCANSLTGIGSIEEAEEALQLAGTDSQLAIFDNVIRDALEEAHNLLIEWSDASEATKAEIEHAHSLAKRAEEKTRPVRGMLDVALASIAGVVDKKRILEPSQIPILASDKDVVSLISTLQPAHMPFLFPEVFVRDNPGFDVLVGNPPWETLSPDERKFWALKFPGLMGLSVTDRKKRITVYREKHPELVEEMDAASESMRTQRDLLKKKFPLGAGDTDLSEAFAWAFFALIREHGRLGIVLPKTAFSSQGLAGWRRFILQRAEISSLVTIVNSGQWAFNIHPQYSIALPVIEKGVPSTTRIAGPFHGKSEFLAGRDEGSIWKADVLLGLTESSAFPNIGNQKSADVLSLMRRSPALAEWENLDIRAVREFDSTNDRHLFEHENPKEPVVVISGRGFNIWTPSTGEVFAIGEQSLVRDELIRKLSNQTKLANSAFFGLSWPDGFPSGLPFENARIAFRALTNPTNTRTMIPALVPAGVVLPDTAPYLFFRVRNERAEAFLLAVLSSRVLDWYARKFIETKVMNHFLNAFPIPPMISGSLTDRIIQLSGALAAVDDKYADWAQAVGVEHGSLLGQSERQEAIDELEALVALSYGLETQDLVHIFETFHRGWSYQSTLDSVLRFYDHWKAKK